MIEKRKFLLFIFIFLLLIVAYNHFQPKERELVQKHESHSFTYYMDSICAEYFPNETCGGITGCLKYKNNTAVMFLKVGCKEVRRYHAVECRGGSIYKAIIDTRNWTLISLTPSNWSEVKKVIYIECPEYMKQVKNSS
ncbi:MAG: hypothetical protein J7K01_03480 [Thermovirga sp.]|nr:hypothetical protein [Thermovirga sp.]